MTATPGSAELLALADQIDTARKRHRNSTPGDLRSAHAAIADILFGNMDEIVAALRLAAKPAEEVREARDAFLSMICDAHKWQEDVDGDEQDGRTITWVTYTIVTGHSQLEELANALGIKAPFGETIKATIDLEIEKDIAALSTTGAPKR